MMTIADHRSCPTILPTTPLWTMASNQQRVFHALDVDLFVMVRDPELKRRLAEVRGPEWIIAIAKWVAKEAIIGSEEAIGANIG